MVLTTAAAGLMAPASMAWFKPQFLTAGLALIMLGMGATLTIDVRRSYHGCWLLCFTANDTPGPA